LLSFIASALLLSAGWAQNSGGGENMPQLPVGQTFKQFEYPMWQDGKLKATLSANSATGITLNRAEAMNLVIKTYEDDKVSTTITSPDADLYVAEQKMRTKHTVLIERDDMEASSQDCDFDLKLKKYLLRTNVKVVLKHLDLGGSPASGTTTKPATNPAPAGATPSPAPIRNTQSLLDSPGGYADTNLAPIPPSSPDSK
jgi:hypothetical protein